MRDIKEIFYNIFWQNKACQNLFLLSKEELLDTKSIPINNDDSRSISFPRIIISNVDKEDTSHTTIKHRTEGGLIKSESSIVKKMEKYKPLINNFLESKFGKSLDKFSNELYVNPGNFAKIFMQYLSANEEQKNEILIKELQKFGFIGKHINNLSELENYFRKEFFAKNNKEIFSEENIWNFFELIKSLKDIYINEAYKGLYETNQVLVNSLFEKDNFVDRLKLFNQLYEAEIISPSREDAFVECTNCPPDTYRGTLQLQINPLKLKDFKCPVCQKPLNFYVPYELRKEIYQIIKAKDGLLLNALCQLLAKNQVSYSINQTFLKDIEVDCMFYNSNKVFIVECKMYKINNTHQKLKSKMKEHYGKLISNVKRLNNQEFKDKEIIPILLVNITHSAIIKEVKEEIKLVNEGNYDLFGNILNISQFSHEFNTIFNFR